MQKTDNTALFLSGLMGLGACFSMAIIEIDTAHEMRRARGDYDFVPVVQTGERCRWGDGPIQPCPDPEDWEDWEVEEEEEEFVLPHYCESEYVTCLDE